LGSVVLGATAFRGGLKTEAQANLFAVEQDRVALTRTDR
jgi:hypothetical protein